MPNSAYLLQKMNAYFGTLATYGALTSTVPTTSGGTEISGGSPAYARKAPAWGTATTAVPSVMTATGSSFDVPSGASIAGYQTMDALTAGNYLSGGAVTAQTFSSQGTYVVIPTNTQS